MISWPSESPVMKSLLNRRWAWVCWIAVVGLLVFTSERFEALKRQQKSVSQFESQVLRQRKSAAQTQAEQEDRSKAQQTAADKAMNLASATRGQGSDIRNAAFVMQSIKTMCATAKLASCNIRKTQVQGAGRVFWDNPATGQSFEAAAYSFNVVASRFDLEALNTFFALAQDAKSGIVKIEKINFDRNRVEWEMSVYLRTEEQIEAPSPKEQGSR
jgi:Sec-independent protein translocase protein TatA